MLLTRPKEGSRGPSFSNAVSAVVPPSTLIVSVIDMATIREGNIRNIENAMKYVEPLSPFLPGRENSHVSLALLFSFPSHTISSASDRLMDAETN